MATKTEPKTIIDIFKDGVKVTNLSKAIEHHLTSGKESENRSCEIHIGELKELMESYKDGDKEVYENICSTYNILSIKSKRPFSGAKSREHLFA